MAEEHMGSFDFCNQESTANFSKSLDATNDSLRREFDRLQEIARQSTHTLQEQVNAFERNSLSMFQENSNQMSTMIASLNRANHMSDRQQGLILSPKVSFDSRGLCVTRSTHLETACKKCEQQEVERQLH
jgi:hypothetical protein